MRYFSVLLAIGFLASACSDAVRSGPMPSREPIVEGSEINAVEVFMSRSNLNNTEFEHYKFTKSGLFAECGKINRGRYYPEQQDVLDLKEEEAENLHELSLDYLEYASGSNVRLAEPGTNKNLFDPGTFDLTFYTGEHTDEVKSSVDGISGPTTTAGRKIKKLTVAMRKAAGNRLCGNVEFYGIR